MAPDADVRAPKPRRQSSPLTTAYLVLYNFVSTVAWSVVLGRTVTLAATRGPRYVFFGVGEWTKWTQTMAALEILHSLFGIVRSPLITTFLQVSSRLFLIWGIIHPYPFLAQVPTYSSMLIAWSITEVIRYSYFALTLSGSQPGLLAWLRYNTFFVLYPVGIISECSLVYLATEPAGRSHPLEKPMLYAILAVYIPGSYVLYTYMMTQRQKLMRGLKTKDERAAQ